MKTITIKISSETEFNQFKIDEETVVSVMHPYENQIEMNLKVGIHYLSYFVRGSKGDKYTVEIISPKEIAVKKQYELGNEGQSFGYLTFNL